ncbi:MAG: two-component regulator propeller domain-containing protein, partial [Candidatus Eisenbacteria bacterium]|nr:two-component regulator propeller domain-containing protein [Candidatus Eisenbacteria bacterium]
YTALSRGLGDVYKRQNNVRGLAWDGSRFWLATMGGAVGYDPATGEIDTFHRRNGGLLSDSLRAVAVGPDGRVWFGSDRAGISVLDPASGTWDAFTSLLQPIPGNEIRSLAIRGDTLFVGTAHGFTIFEGDTVRAVCFEGIDLCGLPNYEVRDIVSDPAGDGFWFATSGGVAHRDRAGAWTVYADPPSNTTVQRLIRHRGEWVGAFPDGVRVLRQGAWTLLASGLPQDPVISDLLSEGDVLWVASARGVYRRDGDGDFVPVGDPVIAGTRLLRTPDGALWASTLDVREWMNGLWRLSPDGATWTRKAFPGPGIRAHWLALAFDRDGLLHGTTAQVGEAPFYQTFDGRNWSNPENLRDWSFDILFTADGTQWLAQCCCGASGSCELSFKNGPSREYLEPRNVRDLALDEQGRIWAGSYNDDDQWAEGIYMRPANGSDWQQFTVASTGTMLSNRVRAIIPYRGEVWIGYAQAGVHRWNPGADGVYGTVDDTWTLYSTETPGRTLLSDGVTRIAPQGSKIWIGTAGGISIVDLETGAITQIGQAYDRLPSSQVNFLLPTDDGGAWVSTFQSGLTRMTPEGSFFTFTTYTPPDLPNPNVETLAIDPDGRSLWIGTSRGLAHFVPPAAGQEGKADLAAYPNPFLPGCSDGIRLLGYEGSGDGIVVDLSGKTVRRFERRYAGDLVWDGLDGSGDPVSPGLYWIRLSTPEGIRAVGVGIADGPCR